MKWKKIRNESRWDSLCERFKIVLHKDGRYRLAFKWESCLYVEKFKTMEEARGFANGFSFCLENPTS